MQLLLGWKVVYPVSMMALLGGLDAAIWVNRSVVGVRILD